MNGVSEVDGYRVQANIHTSSRTQVARAVATDGRPVILKMCQNPYPDDETIERFRQEYAVLAHLGGRGAVSALALTRHQNAPVLVLQDDAGVSLADWLESGSHTLEDILAVTVEIARAMAEIHAAGVIHRNISPEHVLVHAGAGRASFIDFSLALQTGTDGDRRLSLDALMGAYWYLAPEATGRTERPVDERSDLYALGALFYRMLGGAPPFSSPNPMEVIHAHLAVTPAPLTQGPCGPVPAMVASMVQRLLAKNPDDRYQRAGGLLADLERCLDDLQSTGDVLSFTVGERDRSLRLRLSPKVYGRDDEWQTVQRALRRVGDGAAEWIVLTGPEGIGKTALLREVEERVRDAGAHVGLATFVDDDPDGPLGGLVRSLGGVIRSLLELPDRDVNHWRRRLREVLGPAALSLAGLVPHLAECLQIDPLETPAAAERRRSILEDSLPKLIDGLVGAEAPLVLLFDDLQLADDASLTFLQHLFTDARAEYLLVVGTERTEDGPPAVGLEATLEEMRRHTAALTEVEISPLTVQDLQAFLADSLTMEAGRVSDLADVLQRKTAGNPFGARQLLELWQQRDLLRPDPGSSGWRWDAEGLEQATGTDHGVRFLVERVAALPVDTQRMLGLAAVIGTEFDGSLLAHLLDQPDETLRSLLAEPLESGLLEPVDGEPDPGIGRFRFTHAAVRQTVLGEVSLENSTGAHLAIVRWLDDSLTEEGRASRAAELADHWNQAGILASDPRERTRAAMANKMAGDAAEAAGRYAAALAYYEAGIGWLAEDCWEREVPLTSALYFGQMRMLRTVNDRETELEMAQMVAERSPRMEDKLHAAGVQIGCYTSRGDAVQIVETGIAALEAVDIHVPRRVSRREAVATYEVVKSLMAGRTREELLAVPTVEDPTISEAMRVLTLMGNGAGSDRVWYGYLGLLAAEMSLRYGYNSASGSAFTSALAVLGIERREYLTEAFELGLLGVEISRRFDSTSLMNSLSAFSMQVNHWRRPLRESLEGVREFYAICRSTGRDSHLYLHSPTSVLLELACGMGLDAIRAEAEDSLGWVQDLQVAVAASLLEPLLDTLDALAGRKLYAAVPLDSELDASGMMDPDVALTHAYLTTLGGYLFGQLEDALRAGDQAFANLHVRPDLVDFLTPETLYYYGLAIAQAYRGADDATQQHLRARLSRILRLFGEWAASSPSNYQQKLDLLQAERRRHLGASGNPPGLDLLDLYDAAIEGSARHGYLQNQAIGNELAGQFALSRGKERLARMYLVEARYLYRQWGALGKVRQLEALYPHLLPPEKDVSGAAATAVVRVPDDAGGDLNLSVVDLATVVRSSQVISGEVRLDRLLGRLLQLAMENAGAERGVLALMRDNAWVIEAVGNVSGALETMQAIPLDEAGELISLGIAQYVLRTQEPVILADAAGAGRFVRDPYVRRRQVRSVLCLPVVKQGRVEALLYLENNLGSGAFTSDRAEVLRLLSGQAAISIENARMYETLDRQIQERTEALKRSQQQIVESDRMASLGQLTAGVAHEINNPVNFVVSSAAPLRRDVEDVLEAVGRYEAVLIEAGKGDAVARIQREIQLEDAKEEIQDLLTGIEEGGKRTAEIVKGLRSFSRVDEGDLKPASVTDGIESTLVLLRKQYEPRIQIVREYDPVPEIPCFPGQLNQVYMNLLVNAIQAIQGEGEIRITVREVDDAVEIRIGDSGQGMPEEVRKRIFEPFFTTKEVGVGTGLGLAITYGIMERHHGSIVVDSVPDEGTTFTLRLPLAQDHTDQRAG